jgi:hypothetical protein
MNKNKISFGKEDFYSLLKLPDPREFFSALDFSVIE